MRQFEPTYLPNPPIHNIYYSTVMYLELALAAGEVQRVVPVDVLGVDFILAAGFKQPLADGEVPAQTVYGCAHG